MRKTRKSESGVVLVSVLVILAIASTLVFLMLSSQEISLGQARKMSSISAADALARGAETTAITALRRDMENSPEADHYGEDWTSVVQEEVDLGIGRFSVAILDSQSKLDLNNLRTGGLQEAQVFLRLFTALDLPPALAQRIAAELARKPDTASLEELDSLDAPTRLVLKPYVDILPRTSKLNLNTAPRELLLVVFNNPSAASRLASLRERQGFLLSDDLGRVGAVQPPGTGFTSQVYDVVVSVEVDGIDMRLESRLLRDPRSGVVVTSRKYGFDGPDAPPDPAAEY